MMALRTPIAKQLFLRLAELVETLRQRLPEERVREALPIVAALPLVLVERERVARFASWLLTGADEPARALLTEVFAAAGVLEGAAQGSLRRQEVAEVESLVPKDVAHNPHFLERLLTACDADKRKRRGVFFTPPPLAQYIVRETDRLLREEFGLAEGIAAEVGRLSLRDSAPFRGAEGESIRILDPAVGTGVFLLAAVDAIYLSLSRGWKEHGLSPAKRQDVWNGYVPRLLPRLAGIDIQPAACLLAQLQLALKLEQLGYRFETPGALRIVVGDALAGPDDSLAGRLLAEPFNVLLGNPPFSGVSDNKHPWIERLVDGDAASGVRGYFEVDGRPLGERKHWLKDDYVKFVRLAQWRVEESGGGIVGFVTNHGYLDNATFRGMRQQLARAFDRIAVIDLHGNRKKHEIAPDGGQDENLFGIDQGVAMGMFRKLPASGEDSCSQTIQFSDLWGTRDEKLRQLAHGPTLQDVRLTSPHYRFVPSPSVEHPEYLAAPKLTELFPSNVTAPVTARDAFVIAFTREELIERIEVFRDLAIPDDEIRRRYFTSTRSNKYPAGDTRGWKLSEVRRALAADDGWQRCVRRCLYRPFDWRWIAWDERLIDWPRTEVTERLLEADSLALITRRQQLPGRACTFFWVSAGLAIDGVIRSDNKGSESLFVVEPEQRELAAAAYALFHSPAYRERYAHELRHDFPRVLLPSDADDFQALVEVGKQLIDLHSLRGVAAWPEVAERLAEVTILPRYPRYEAGGIAVTPAIRLEQVPETLWAFQAGGHQPGNKWLANRRGRKITAGDAQHYACLLTAIEGTCRLVQTLNKLKGHLARS